MNLNTCTKCGKSHGMVVENSETGKIKPMDLCYDCLWFGTFNPIKKQISFDDLPEVCDSNILQNEMSEIMKKLFVGKDENCKKCKNELVACVCMEIDND